jgi:hypothetical protein
MALKHSRNWRNRSRGQLLSDQSATGCLIKAPAGNIAARGKREAKQSASPLVVKSTRRRGLKGRNSISPFSGLIGFLKFATKGDALRFASRLPLAFIFRAVGAAINDQPLL